MKKTCKLKNEEFKIRLMELGGMLPLYSDEMIDLDTLSKDDMKSIIREVLIEEFRKELFD